MVPDLVFISLLALISAGLGLQILRLLNEMPRNPADAWALALPLGLGSMALVVLGLGEIGALSSLAMVMLLVVGGMLALPALIQLPRPWSQFERNGPVSLIWDALLIIVLGSTLLTALAPVTDGDALCYHLQVPKTFLAAGSVGFDPDLHETIYPLLTEMLYVIGLALRGPVACRLIQWLLGVVLALNVTAVARPFLGSRARWAGTIALLVPAVSNGMGAPLNDVALAAFGNATIFAWLRWHERSRYSSALIVGLLAGLALGVKYPALVLTSVIGLAMLVDSYRARRILQDSDDESESTWNIRHIKGRHYVDPRDVLNFERKVGPFPTAPRRAHPLRQVIVFGIVALFLGSVWYLRAYYHTGNPVYPFFRHLFGGAGLDEVLDPIKRPMPVTIWNLLTAIGPMTLNPAKFDSVSHQFGPLFLLVLPALFWERPPRRIWAIIGIGYLFLMLCLTQRQSMRFVLIAVGPMAVGVAWVASQWWDRPTIPARALIILLIGCLGFEAAIAVARTRHGLSVVLGLETESAYLSRREPTYRVGQWIDTHLAPTARLVGQDHRGYYIPRGYSMELAHRRATGLGTHGESSDQMAEALLHDGFTHLLLCPPVPEDAVEFDPTLLRRMAPWLDKHEAIYQETLPDSDGVSRHYMIYELGVPGSSVDSSLRAGR